MTKLLAIDSSSTCSGYSVFIDGKYVKSGCIDLKKYTGDKFTEMVVRLFTLIEVERPAVVVAEEMVVPRNPQVARLLTMILGALCGKCLIDGVFFTTLRPTEWRSRVRDKNEKMPRKREELKEWSKHRVEELFGVNNVNDDVSDSILIGEAYIRMMSGGNDEKENEK